LQVCHISTLKREVESSPESLSTIIYDAISKERTEILISVMVRYYATNRKVAGSIPDEVIFFLNLLNPSGRTRPWGLLRLQQKWVPETEK
jgi:hypothetical protein